MLRAMPIVTRVSELLTAAMKARDKARTSALRGIRAALLHEMKKDGAETLGDDACVSVLRRLEKQRKESIAVFHDAGRTERADAERGELAVVREFLPSLADAATTRAWLEAAIAASGAQSAADTGRVMGALMKQHRGEVDGTLAQKIAKELLAPK